MKKISALLTVIGALVLFLLLSCSSDPEKATRKDMIKHHEFIYDYNSDGDDFFDYKLTIEKNYTYSLHIKDFDLSDNYVVIMKTFTGKWSHVLTYEYKYDTTVSDIGILFKTTEASLGIYMLEGYVRKNSDGQVLQGYFGYEKSSGKGSVFTTDKTIDEKFLESYRQPSHAALGNYYGPVELPGFEFKSKKK